MSPLPHCTHYTQSLQCLAFWSAPNCNPFTINRALTLDVDDGVHEEKLFSDLRILLSSMQHHLLPTPANDSQFAAAHAPTPVEPFPSSSLASHRTSGLEGVALASNLPLITAAAGYQWTLSHTLDAGVSMKMCIQKNTLDVCWAVGS